MKKLVIGVSLSLLLAFSAMADEEVPAVGETQTTGICHTDIPWI